MKIFHNLKKAASYVLPYLKPTYSNIAKPLAVAYAAILPAVDLMMLSIHKKSASSKEEEEEDSGIYVIAGVFVGASFLLRPVLIKYIAESIKVSIKISNIEKYLDAENKFLISGNHSEWTEKIKSLQEVTVGYRVNSLADAIVPIYIGLPIVAISIACGIVRIESTSNFLDTNAYQVVFPTLIGCTLVIYGAGKLLGRYDTQDSEANSNLLMRTAFIENNPDAVTLMKAITYEKDVAIQSLMTKEKIISPYAALELSYISASIGTGEFLIYYLAIHAEKTMLVPRLMYLSFSIYALSRDLIYFVNTASQAFENLNDHLDKIEEFSAAYNKWCDTYSQNNTMITEFKGDVFSLRNFSIYKTENFKEQEERLIEYETPLITTDQENILLRDVSIELLPRKAYQLMGESGAGKTTILKSIQGYWPYTDGIVTFPASKDAIYCIPQKLCFPPKSTLVEIIAYPLTTEALMEKFGGHSNLIKEIELLIRKSSLSSSLSIHHLESIEHNLEWRLSGGEKQKISIISAILKRPQFLIMDEATTSLDSKNKETMYKLIKEYLHDTTVLFTDHNPVDFFADEMLCINNYNLNLLTHDLSDVDVFLTGKDL